MVDGINQTQLLLQQQQKQVEESRRQAQQIQTKERPTMAQLMQRSIQNLPAIQSQQLAAEQYKSQKLAEIGESEKQVAQSQAEFETWKASESGKITQYLESGGHARVIRYPSGLIQGYKYGDVYVPAQYDTSLTPEQKAGSQLETIKQRYNPIVDSLGNLKGFEDTQKKISIPSENLTAKQISELQRAGMIGAITVTPSFVKNNNQFSPQDIFNNIKVEPIQKQTFGQKLIKSLEFDKTANTFSQLTQQYKGTPLGYVYAAPKAISSGVSSIFQKTGLSAGESKAVGESAGSAALFGFFSPLFTSAMAKKGTKTVSVEEKKTEEAAKKVSKEAAKNLIRENAIRNPDANRQIIKTILEKARETNNPEAVKNYQKVFAEVLGKQKAAELFKDVVQQEGIYVRAIQPQQLQVLKPVAKLEVTKPVVEIAAETLRRQPTQYPLGVLFPSIVQAGGKSQSIFSGKGTYELSSGQLPKSIISLKQPQIETQIPKQIQPSVLKMQTESQLGFKQIQPLKSIQLAQPALMSSFKLSPQLQYKSELKTDLYNIYSETALKLKSPLGKISKSSFSLFKKKRFAALKFKAFETQVKKRGRFETIGRGLPLGRALRLGAVRTATTLSQTFRLVPKGFTSLKDIQYSVPSRIFTKPKRAVGGIAFVERRGMTLKRGTGEIPQIQAARRKLKWY